MSTTANIQLSASLEDYLETIFRIVQDKKVARAKEIGKRLKVSRSSVTGALRALADRELINYAPYDVITMTDTGQDVARNIVRRHEVLRDFFVKVLAVNKSDADAAACRMEHAIPEKILERFISFVDFVERCPRSGSTWIDGFGYSCGHPCETPDCGACMTQALEDYRSKPMPDSDEAADRTLGDLKPKDKAAIVKIEGAGGIRRRLLDMGATAGTVVEVERVAPLGDPIEVKIKGYHLTLRKEEARRIQVRAI